MAGLKNDLYAVQTALTQIMDKARSHNTIALSITEVRSLFGVSTPNCEIRLPVRVTWTSADTYKHVNTGRVDLSFHDRYLSGYEVPSGHAPLVERIDGWADRACKLQYQVGLCREVLSTLHTVCSSPQQVRYLLPALQILCAPHTDLQQLRARITSVTPPRAMPGVTAEFRAACKEANMYITAASLYEASGSWPGGASVALDSDFTFHAHGLTFR